MYLQKRNSALDTIKKNKTIEMKKYFIRDVETDYQLQT